MSRRSVIKGMRRAYQRAAKTSKPGEGKRFAALEKVVAAQGAKNPAAVAASIGRKKYGKKRFAEMGRNARAKKR